MDPHICYKIYSHLRIYSELIILCYIGILISFRGDLVDMIEDNQEEVCVEVSHGKLNRVVEVSASAHPLSAQSKSKHD